MKNSIKKYKLFEELGCPLRNKRNHLSASEPDRKRTIFTIWDHGIKGNTYTLVSEGDAPWKKRPGAIQLRKDIELALSGNSEILGVLCHAVDPLAEPKSIEYFDEKALLTIDIARHGDEVLATITGEVSLEAALKGTVSKNKSDRKDAFDDLDDTPEGAETPEQLRVEGLAYKRNGMVRDHVIRRASGRCEYCGELGFLMSGGKRYIEAHHIIGLGDGGPDTVANVIGLCPKHHREAHFGEGALDLNEAFQKILQSL
jgi:5-methylcytosine-specific restriction protein A